MSKLGEQQLVSYIKENIKNITVFSEAKTYFYPTIDEKKLKNAKAKYAQNVFDDRVIALHDRTILGKGDGFIITSNALYFYPFGGETQMILFKLMEKIELIETKKKPKVEVHLSNGQIQLPTHMFKGEETASLLNAIQGYYDSFKEEGVEIIPDRILTLEEMKKSVQIAYIKCLVQFDVDYNDSLGAGPLTEIMSLMTQLHFTAEMRHEIRTYISDTKEELPQSLDELLTMVPERNQESIKLSLMKDMIRVKRSRDTKTKASESEEIINVAKLYAISPEQINVIEEFIINEEKFIRGEISEAAFVRQFKDLAAKGMAVGVPIIAVYVSGSVIGLSAAGITSGLAALGFGGILGLSSMVTGIGVLIVGGVIVYKGVKYFTGSNEREKKSRREKMIQEVVKNLQLTVNSLIEDIEFFTSKMNDLIENRKVNEHKLMKLKMEINLFKEAMYNLKNKETLLTNNKY